MVLLHQLELKELVRFKLLSTYSIQEYPEILIVKAHAHALPKTQFKEAMIGVGQLVVKGKFTKIILDASVVKLLDQLCVEWYELVWRELMSYNGLNNHCFVVPRKKSLNVTFSPTIHLFDSLESAIEQA